MLPENPHFRLFCNVPKNGSLVVRSRDGCIVLRWMEINIVDRHTELALLQSVHGTAIHVPQPCAAREGCCTNSLWGTGPSSHSNKFFLTTFGKGAVLLLLHHLAETHALKFLPIYDVESVNI